MGEAAVQPSENSIAMKGAADTTDCNVSAIRFGEWLAGGRAIRCMPIGEVREQARNESLDDPCTDRLWMVCKRHEFREIDSD